MHIEAVKDRYGWAVIINHDFRSAMPDESTAKMMAESWNMFQALRGVDNCFVVKDGINGQKSWLTHDALIGDIKK